jgi:C4-dicarboxylate-specific signal transduction histidine kinase
MSKDSSNFSNRFLKLNHLFGEMGQIIFATDTQGVVFYANKEAEKILGYPSSTFLGVLKLQELSRNLTLEKYIENEVSLLTFAQEHLPVSINSVEIRNDEGKIDGYLFFCRDLRRQIALLEGLEKSIESQKQTLIHSSKKASLGDMAGGIAHEINNPLAIIMGKAERVFRALDDPKYPREVMKVDVDKIRSTSARIAKIVNSLRMFARSGEKDPLELVELSKVINDAIGLCHERMKMHGLEIRQVGIPVVKIECQPMQLVHVVLNLLNNAFDAVKDHENPWIEVQAEYVQGKKIVLSVIDSGHGIPEEVAKNLMQPFFTTKDVGEGTGLGLSSSEGIIKDHHGKLYYDSSTPNTRFVIEIPVLQSIQLAS